MEFLENFMATTIDEAGDTVTAAKYMDQLVRGPGGREGRQGRPAGSGRRVAAGRTRAALAPQAQPAG